MAWNGESGVIAIVVPMYVARPASTLQSQICCTLAHRRGVVNVNGHSGVAGAVGVSALDHIDP